MERKEIVSIVDDPNVIVTRSGTYFNFVDPKPEQVNLSDISYALSNINRWGGHHRQKVSVAQHSITVSRLLRQHGFSLQIQLQGLMHDASEAYVGDICRPIKAKLPVFYEMEDNVMRVIAAALKFEWPMVTETKLADDEALVSEWNHWKRGQDLPDTMDAEVAAMAFEKEYYRLRMEIEESKPHNPPGMLYFLDKEIKLESWEKWRRVVSVDDECAVVNHDNGIPEKIHKNEFMRYKFQIREAQV